MDELLKRRDMMRGDSPIFLDYIENGIGDPLTMDLPIPTWSSSDTFEAKVNIHTLNDMPENTAFFALDNIVGYADQRCYRLWDNLALESVQSSRAQAAGDNVTVHISHSPNYQTKGLVIGINNASWSPQTNNMPIRAGGWIGFVRHNHAANYKIRYGNTIIGINGKVVVDLRPCYYQGEYGFWNMTDSKFYGNCADGASFSGPNII